MRKKQGLVFLLLKIQIMGEEFAKICIFNGLKKLQVCIYMRFATAFRPSWFPI